MAKEKKQNKWKKPILIIIILLLALALASFIHNKMTSNVIKESDANYE